MGYFLNTTNNFLSLPCPPLDSTETNSQMGTSRAWKCLSRTDRSAQHDYRNLFKKFNYTNNKTSNMKSWYERDWEMLRNVERSRCSAVRLLVLKLNYRVSTVSRIKWGSHKSSHVPRETVFFCFFFSVFLACCWHFDVPLRSSTMSLETNIIADLRSFAIN